jgi:hypothetical protein
MNYLLTVTAAHLKPRREEPMKRSRGIPMKPRASMPSSASRTRRHSLPRVRAALSVRHRTGGLPGPDSQPAAGSGVSPIASGASRGVAILGRW